MSSYIVARNVITMKINPVPKKDIIFYCCKVYNIPKLITYFDDMIMLSNSMFIKLHIHYTGIMFISIYYNTNCPVAQEMKRKQER